MGYGRHRKETPMQREPKSARSAEAARLVTFEAPTLWELREDVERWISETPDLQPISFSHAVRERLGGHPMGAGRISVFTGALLVRAV